MPNAVIFTSFKLKEEASIPNFLLASDKFHSVFVSKQKGLISSKLLVDGEMWADIALWETMDAAKSAEPQTPEEKTAMSEYFSFIDGKSAVHHRLYVEKSY